MAERTESAFIFFDSGIMRYPSRPDPWITEGSKKLDVFEFIDEIGSGDSLTCPAQAFSSAFDTIARGNAMQNIILFVHAVHGTCGQEDESPYLDEMLDASTAMNGGKAQIHTFSIHPIEPGRREFLRRLAESNGGAYTALWAERP